MRPRVFPAEDRPETHARRAAPRARFNEAAGIPRGRVVSGRRLPRRGRPARASMRPRVFPAEDSLTAAPRDRASPRRFNEAAGIPRGRPPESMNHQPRPPFRFNEAAGIPRGRQSALRPIAQRRGRFNEAAGIPRGRLWTLSRMAQMGRGFNEAAGIPRGRPGDLVILVTHYFRFNEAAGIPRGRL